MSINIFAVIADVKSAISKVTRCISLPVFVFISRSDTSKTHPETTTLPELSLSDAIDTISLSLIGLPTSIISADTTLPITSGFSSATGLFDIVL